MIRMRNRIAAGHPAAQHEITTDDKIRSIFVRRTLAPMPGSTMRWPSPRHRFVRITPDEAANQFRLRLALAIVDRVELPVSR